MANLKQHDECADCGCLALVAFGDVERQGRISIIVWTCSGCGHLNASAYDFRSRQAVGAELADTLGTGCFPSDQDRASL